MEEIGSERRDGRGVPDTRVLLIFPKEPRTRSPGPTGHAAASPLTFTNVAEKSLTALSLGGRGAVPARAHLGLGCSGTGRGCGMGGCGTGRREGLCGHSAVGKPLREGSVAPLALWEGRGSSVLTWAPVSVLGKGWEWESTRGCF